MVIRTCGGNSYANMEHSFQVGQWYHICFFHYYEKELFFKYPTLAVYVNGRLAHKQILKFPSTSGPLFQRVIGNVKTQTFVKRTADTTLRGGIASVAIGAGAPLAPAAVARLYSQGPEFIPTTHYLRTALRSIIALDFVVTPHALEPIAVASRTRTRARTKSTTKRSEAAAAAAAEEEASDEEEITGCYNTDFVPLKKGGPEDAGCGVLFPGVRTVNCTSAKTAFFAAVGVKALLPLFHPAVLERWPGVSLELAAKAVTAALRNDKREYIEYARVKGSEVIAGLLLQAANWPVKGKKACKNEGKSESESDGGVNTSETASTDNSSQKFLISDGAIAAFRELGGILEMFPRTRGMAYRPLLLNFGCWRGASPQVQHNLAEAALMTLTLNPRYSRRYVGVGSILAGLDKYSTATVGGGGEGGEGINAEDAIVIREILCRILEFFYLEAGERITREEVAALVAFVKVSTAPGDIRCAMNVLMKALQASRRAFTDFFTDTCDGGNLFLRLAGHEDAEVRILGIKAAGLFLYRSADAPQQKAVVRDFPFDKLCDVLLRYPFDYKTYLAMVQLYTMDYADDVCSVYIRPL